MCSRSDLFAFYAHLSNTVVTVDRLVKVGEVIGYTGHTGNASKAVFWLSCRKFRGMQDWSIQAMASNHFEWMSHG
jgi:hypothetical protein